MVSWQMTYGKFQNFMSINNSWGMRLLCTVRAAKGKAWSISGQRQRILYQGKLRGYKETSHALI